MSTSLLILLARHDQNQFALVVERLVAVIFFYEVEIQLFIIRERRAKVLDILPKFSYSNIRSMYLFDEDILNI